MISLRDLLRRVARDSRLPPVRPTSLYAAAATGTRPGTDGGQPSPRPASEPARSRSLDAAATDVEPLLARPRTFDDTAIEARERRMRTTTVIPGARRARLARVLRNPVAMRQAIVMREVLGPPVALRRHEDVGSGEDI